MQPPNGMAALEALGFKFSKRDGKDLFIDAEIPVGWKKVPTDHAMWSNLLDPQGRVRASIFYKAAFYDRAAFMDLAQRYTMDRDWKDKTRALVTVLDNGTVPPSKLHTIARAASNPSYLAYDAAYADAWAWLAEHYPDWENPAAYW
jgi:hypothetical protein